MDCKSAQDLLEAYLDNELDRADARQIESHVDTCPACRDALSHLDELRRALRDSALRYAAPQSLRERIRTSAQSAATAYSVGHGVARWTRLAAACVLAFGAGGLSMQAWNSAQSVQAQTTRDLFASHWRALAAATPVDVVSSDRHTVKPWFAGKVAAAPPVRDFADQGFALAGGRVDYVGAQRVPVLVYRHGQHLIDVFVLPATAGNALPGHAQAQGYVLSTVMLDAQPAAIVSDMDPTELGRFTELLRQ
jgi:anti-sigma factor (TIGR02949 family)